jgi:hypothetical protein
MGKLIYETLQNGETINKLITTNPALNVGNSVITRPGLGKPFWFFPSIPTNPDPINMVMVVDYSLAPIVDSSAAVNNTAIAAITVDAADVISYEPKI